MIYLLQNFMHMVLSEDAVTFVHSCLNVKKQGVKINDTQSFFQILLSGIPEGSILGLILFNILINDFVFFANFADGNTIYASGNSKTNS